jgi:hypothetical protein
MGEEGLGWVVGEPGAKEVLGDWVEPEGPCVDIMCEWGDVCGEAWQGEHRGSGGGMVGWMWNEWWQRREVGD